MDNNPFTTPPCFNSMASKAANTFKRQADPSLGDQFKKLKYNSNKDNTFIVRQEEKIFTVEDDLLKRHARLDNITTSTSVIAEPGKQITLKDRRPEVFQIYLDCIWYPDQDLAELALKAVQQTTTRKTYGKTSITAVLINLWVLADLLGDKKCKNRVTNTLVTNFDAGRVCVGAGHVDLAFEWTDAGSSLRLRAIDSVMSGKTAQFLDDAEEELPVDFERIALRRLVEKIAKREHMGRPRPEDACLYHCHEAGEPRCT